MASMAAALPETLLQNSESTVKPENIYGRPFDSSSVPARNLNAEAIYKRTVISLEFRPLERRRTTVPEDYF
jgi:hypothetical protein